MATAIRLVIGLANPGNEYANTRHNAGGWFVSRLAEIDNVSFKLDSKLKAYIAKLPNGVLLMIPTTYMNESGQAVQLVSRFYKIAPEEILVAHDELDFPPGHIKLKQAGGHGGHNGLRDIMQKIASRDFWRLRIGIGHPGHKDQVSSYVLHKPSVADRQQIDNTIEDGARVMDTVYAGEFEAAMQQLHG